jgi:hypothetical protein
MRSEHGASPASPRVRRFVLAPLEDERTADVRGGGMDAGTTGYSHRDLEVIDRLDRLRLVLPGLVRDATEARRETARLRRENGQLARRLTELETRLAGRWLPEREPAA